ncbi:MAG: DUF1573 domain-containing protein [Tannerella sp.]|jgi:ABC-type Fe3+-hydroxamate transport system substrate-binding protein|nr:DUF1573 domain-containing protein [Tannerella sp.]
MKRILFVIMLVALTIGAVSAQQKEASITVTESETHDFGDIKEADGPVSHTFTVINNGELPLVISRVVASCGCTTPNWTKEPIAPGKTGDIKVTYDPTGRPNQFAKTVNVYSNGKTGSYVLTIRGNVIPK